MTDIQILDRDLLRVIATQYGFEHVDVQAAIGGLSSQNYFIIADKDEFVLKRYRQTELKNVQQIEAITTLLHDHAIPVAMPLSISTNKLHFTYDDHFFAVLPKIKGAVYHGESITKQALSSVALQLSRFHLIGKQAGLNLHTTSDRAMSPKTVEEKAQELRVLLEKNLLDAETDDLTRQLIDTKLLLVSSLRISDEILSAAPQNDLVHGDFHNENLLFDDRQNVVSVLDFEEVHYGYAAEDVMAFINFALCNSGFDAQQLHLAQYFLSEYRSHRYLSKQDIELGIKLTVYRLASSFFLETELYRSGDYSLKHFLVRDLHKFRYFQEHLPELVAVLTSKYNEV